MPNLSQAQAVCVGIKATLCRLSPTLLLVCPVVLSLPQTCSAGANSCLLHMQAYQRTVESSNLQDKVSGVIRLKVWLLFTEVL